MRFWLYLRFILSYRDVEEVLGLDEAAVDSPDKPCATAAIWGVARPR